MIRPVGGDFLYTDAEFEQMKSELLNLKEAVQMVLYLDF
jgi:copper homeostasis protein